MVGTAEIGHSWQREPHSGDAGFANNWEIFTTVGIEPISGSGAALGGAALLPRLALPFGGIEDLAAGDEDRCST